MDLFNRKKLKELKTERNELLAKYFKTQNQLDWLKDTYFKLQKENTKLKEENEHLKEKTTRRKKEITALIEKQKENKKTKHKLNSITGEWRKFKREIKKLEQELNKEKEMNKKLISLDWLKDTYFKLQKENTELKQLNEQKKCKFIQEGDDMDNNYMCTGCGEVWCFEEYTPVEVDCNYCSKCGAKITEVIESLKEDL